MISIRSVVVAAVLFISAAPAASAQDSWSVKAASPRMLSNHGMAALDGKVYAFAGFDPYSWVAASVTLEYDPVTNAWTSKASSPALYNVAAASFGGSIWVTGGISDEEGRDVATTYRYDPSTDTWTLRASMSGARYFHSLVATATHLYAVAGSRYDVGNLSSCEKYDPAADAWTTVAPMPTAATACFAGVVAGRIYVAGGYTDWGPTTQTHEYDPAADRWMRKSDMPVYGRYAGGSVALGGRLWCLGGEDWYTYSSMTSTLEYRPWTDSWTARASMPYGNDYGAACATGGRLYSLGHQAYASYADQLQEYLPPSFGSAPAAPSDLKQIDAAGNEVGAAGWMAGTEITLEATVEDPDSGEPVLLEVELQPAGGTFRGLATRQGGLAEPGRHAIVHGGLDGHDYRWRARCVDVNENASAWVDFGSPTDVDFRNDQAPPSAPACASPYDGADAQVLMSEGGSVTFAWTDATDNAGVASYEVQVTMDEGFNNVLRTATSESTSLALSLATSRYAYRWRVRATDISGNVGPWSAPAAFRVYFEDRKNHGAGDAVKFCGFSAGSGHGGLALGLVLAGVLALASGLRRRLPVLAALLAAAAPASAQDSWQFRTACPYYVSEAGAANVDGRIFVFGGYSYNFYSGMHTETYEYVPATNSWTYRASLPTGIGDMATAVAGGQVYCIGGYTDSSWYRGYYQYGTVPWCFRYDPSTNAWTEIAELPTPRSHLAAGGVDGKVLAVGGFQYETQLAMNDVEEYDPSTNSWTRKSDYPEDAMLQFYGVVAGRMVVAGGWLNDYSASPRTWIYDASGDRWTAGADLPMGNWGGGSAVLGNRLYCFGSGVDVAYEQRNYEYSVLSNRWNRRADLASRLTWAPAVGGATRAYAFGHATEYGLATQNQEYTPPDFGVAPGAPSGPVQRTPAGTEIAPGAYMGGDAIEFAAVISDPDSAEVGLEVELRRSTEAFTGTATSTGAAGPTGLRTVSVTGLLPGDYKWRVRAYDDKDNVSAWIDYGGPSDSDFRNEQTGPSRPTPVTPAAGAALQSGGSAIGFSWTAATDDQGVASYRIEISDDPGFGSLLQAEETAGLAIDLALPPSWMTYYWRVRATDGVGNVGPWSLVKSFSVVTAEAAGSEENKGCLGSATGAAGLPLASSVLASAVLLAFAGRRRR